MKNSHPKISIITPSYNQGHLIGETIESVVSQNYPNFEHIVIDGASTDDTVDILKNYDEQITWVSEPDDGQADAINKGLEMASGDIITYLNSDDVYLPNTLNTVAEYFRDHQEAMWLTGDYFIIDEYGNKIQSYIAAYKRFLRKNPTFTRLCIANYIIQPSTFWRKELTKKIGLFNEQLEYCMDFDYWLRAMQEHPLHTVPTHFSLFRIHQSSKGGALYQKQFAEEHQVVLQYTQHPIIRILHRIHAFLIVLAYNFVKE